MSLTPAHRKTGASQNAGLAECSLRSLLERVMQTVWTCKGCEAADWLVWHDDHALCGTHSWRPDVNAGPDSAQLTGCSPQQPGSLFHTPCRLAGHSMAACLAIILLWGGTAEGAIDRLVWRVRRGCFWLLMGCCGASWSTVGDRLELIGVPHCCASVRWRYVLWQLQPVRHESHFQPRQACMQHRCCNLT